MFTVEKRAESKKSAKISKRKRTKPRA